MTDHLDLDAMERWANETYSQPVCSGSERNLSHDMLAFIARVRELEAERDVAVSAERKRCAEIARRDVDWTRFNKREIEQWDSGVDGVRDYRLGIKVGEMIALAIERGDEVQEGWSTESA